MVNPHTHKISVDTILSAKAGNETAIRQILLHYKGYMLKLCKIERYDAIGNSYTFYDKELYQELRTKLIIAIQNKFEVR